MELTFHTIILLPMFLGLLGFIEPCTVGSHLVFLGTLDSRRYIEKVVTTFTFIVVRALVAGLFGSLVASLGKGLVGFQTDLWIVFGSIYLGLGIAFLIGKAKWFKHRINLAPDAWKKGHNPVVLGIAFGLNIPACAAPIIFGLLGMAATSGTAMTGFVMMAVFGLFLSLPLIFVAGIPIAATGLEKLSTFLRYNRWILALVFIFLGLWSIWFGLYVDPANWAGS